MNGNQIKYLSEMKKLIKQGKKKFISWRKDRDYIQDLLDIGISESEAWNEILTLAPVNYSPDSKPSYYIKGKEALVFNKKINGVMVYIKIKIEPDNGVDKTLCVSFHIK